MLVVTSDPRDLLVGQHVGDDLRAQPRVHLDESPLVGRQEVRLEEQRVGNADLADVVEEGRLLEQHQPLLTPPKARSKAHRNRRDPFCVPGGRRVLGVDGPGERAEGGDALAPGKALRAFRRGELLHHLR